MDTPVTCFLGYINYLETPVPLYTYVDDSTMFELCHIKSESVLQHSVDIDRSEVDTNDMTINSDEYRSTVTRLIIDANEIDNVQYAKLLARSHHF